MVIPQRFTIVGTFLGFLAGLAEARFLSTTPSPAVFLNTDVTYAIWFVAPLTGAVLLGLLGLLVGVAAGKVRSRHPTASMGLASAGMGLAAVYLGAASGWLRWGGEGVVGGLTRGETPIWFLLGFLASFLSLSCGGNRAERLFAAESRWPWGRLTGVIGLIFMVPVGGIFYYAAGHSGLPKLNRSATLAAGHGSPNIVLITLDTVRADHLSSYGYARPTTPNLDRWAREGVLFENAIAPSSWTLASHASLFTGLLPHQHGANQATPLYPGPVPLARILQTRGYETAGFSANLSYGYSGWGMSQGFETYEDDSISLRHNLLKTKAGRRLVQPVYERLVHIDDLDRRNAGQLNGSVLRWFQRRSGRPYFLFVNYYDAHLAYDAPPPFRNRFGSVDQASMKEVILTETGRLSKPLSRHESEALVAGYDNSLAYLDAEVDRLLQAVKESPDGANTIVIITSDHGEAFGEHEEYGHGYDLHREVLHVPLILFGPGIPANRRIENLVRIREIFPTTLDMSGGISGPFGRASLRRFWTPGFQSEAYDDFVVSQLVSISLDFQPAFASLMTPDWHYIHNSAGGAKLYRWKADPREEVNLAESPTNQETRRGLHAQLLHHLARSYRPWRGPEYLFGLDGPGYSFPWTATFGQIPRPDPPEAERRIGTSQAHFMQESTSPRHLLPADEELLKSLPY